MRRLSLYLLSLLLAGTPLFLMTADVQAMSAMSVTGTGISSNSSTANAAITPTINYTLASALNADGQIMLITLNGMTVAGGQTLAAGDLTLTCNGTGKTLEASPGSANNDAWEVSITNGAAGNSNPQITITLDNVDGVPTAPSCPAAAVTLAVAGSQLTASATAGNYGITITTSNEAGAFFYYVGDENDVQVQATVDSILSFVVRNSADSSDLGNVNGAAVGPNLCDLGNLSTTGVQTCVYRLKVTTNAAAGYTVNIQTDGSLRKGSDFIPNQAENTTVTSGNAGYALALTGGSYDPDGAGSVYTPTACTEAGDFTDDDTPTATALAAGINTSLYSCAGANSPASTDTTNTALVTHRAESDASTPAGTYVQLVTYTVTASF